MPKLPPGELSHHKTKGFRITCGFYMGTDGKKRPKVFWLGHDKTQALMLAHKFRWANWVANAENGWTKDYEQIIRQQDSLAMIRERFQEAERLRQTLAPHLTPPVIVQLPPDPTPAASTVTAHQPKFSAGTPMFHAALDAFVESEKSRQDISLSHKRTTGDSIKALKLYRADCPLQEIDYSWLEKLSNELKARPQSRKRDSRTGKKMPIKPYTVRRLLKHLGRGLRWIGRHRESRRFGGWHPPADWQDLCRVELKKLMTKKERDRAADGPEQWTIAELIKIFHSASQSRPELHPILFLLGLFAGMGQTELSTARRDEFDLNAATFSHRRNKTGQQGIYWLPPELISRLEVYFKKHKVPAGEPVFRNRGGGLLVNPTSDAVRQAWQAWRKRSGVKRFGMGFYSLRHFFGDYAKRFGGSDVGQAALAHTDKTELIHYSGSRNFEQVKAAGQQLHAELTQAGMFNPPPKPEEEQTEGRSEAAWA